MNAKTAMWRGFADEMLKISMPPGAMARPAAAGPGPAPGGGDAPQTPFTGSDLSANTLTPAAEPARGAEAAPGPAPASVLSPQKAGQPKPGIATATTAPEAAAPELRARPVGQAGAN